MFLLKQNDQARQRESLAEPGTDFLTISRSEERSVLRGALGQNAKTAEASAAQASRLQEPGLGGGSARLGCKRQADRIHHRSAGYVAVTASS